jgi:Galactose oxidase, central domain/Kelch motif
MKKNRCFSRFSLALGISLLLFVGFSSAQWSPRGPAPRLGHSAVLDTAHNKMIVFGGYTSTNDSPASAHFNDVWYLNSANSTNPSLTWQQATVAAGPIPNARAGHSAVLDSVNNRMIVFGGFEGFADPVDNDVWVLENANGIGGTPTWTKLSPSGTPPPARSNHTAVYNPNSNRMIVFGGNNGGFGFNKVEFNDVWVLENANGLGGTPTWINFILQGTSGIATRDSHTAVYDVTNNRMIIFGGHNSFTGTLYSDTWILFNADDTQPTVCNGVGCMSGPLNTSVFPPPPARFGHTAFFDPSSNTMHIFGGVSAAAILNDDWSLSEANALSGVWTQVSPAGTPPLPRYDHTAVYNSSDHRMIIFGGFTAEGLATDTVAVLSNANAQ